MRAIDYAKMGCDTLMRKFTVEELPPSRGFHYHQGVFLSGMQRVYELCGDEKYYNYIKSWIDMFIDDEGNLKWEASADSFDDIQPATLLYPLYEKTKDSRYKKTLDHLIRFYNDWPANEFGGFWHKRFFENQMWLDCIYMAGPFAVMYAKNFDCAEYFDLIYRQMKVMWENMRDADTGLLYHAWDCTKEAEWADKKTGLSPEFWGRALGWYVVSLLDLADHLPENYKHLNEFIENDVELLKSLVKFQDEKTGMWYQVVNRGDDENNWIETSCSCLYTYALAKAIRKGYLGKEYIPNLERAYKGIINSIRIEDNNLFVDNVCIGTGVMSYREYLERPAVTNDLHGMGAFVLMCTEYEKFELSR